MHLFRMLRNLENGNGSGGAAGAGTPPPPAAAAPPASAAPPAAALEPWRDPTEIKKYFQRVQTLEAELATLKAAASPPAPGAAATTPAPAGTSPSSADITAQITAEVTFNTALSMTQGLSGDQQGILRTLFTAEKPAPDKLGDWMKTKLAAFGRTSTAPAGTAQQATTPPAQSQARTDLGAPAAGVGDALPDDPRAIPADQWKAMDPDKRHAITKRWMSRNGGDSGILRRNRA